MSVFISNNKGHKFLFFLLIAPLLPALVKSIILSFGDISSYYQLYYFIGYEYGFGGRKLLGTIFCNLLPYYVGHHQLLPIIWGINLVFLILFFWFITKGLTHASSYGIKSIVLIIYASWFVSPFSIANYYSQGVSIMFPEIWSMSLILLFIIIYYYAHNKWWYYLLTLLICISGCLIHHVFCCLFFPFVFSVIITDIISSYNNSNHEALNKTILYGVICLLITMCFICVWLFSTMNISLDSLYETICQRTDSNVCSHEKDALIQMYFMSNNENTSNISTFFYIRVIELFLTIIITSPLIVLLFIPWFIAFKNTSSKTNKWKYFLASTIPTVLHIPIYCFAIDYGRWEYAWFFNYICLIILYVWNGDTGIIEALIKIKEWTKNHIILFVCVFMYIAILPASSAWYIPEIHKLAIHFL